mgnify:CR=1 FL=1
MILDNAVLQIISKYLSQTEAKRASLFGSYAKGDAKEESDLDILIEFDPTVSLLKFVRYKREMENLTGKKIDLLTPNSISSHIYPLIQKDLQVFYERE